MRKRKYSPLLILFVVSLIGMTCLGVWLKESGFLKEEKRYPAPVYVCLFVQEQLKELQMEKETQLVMIPVDADSEEMEEEPDEIEEETEETEESEAPIIIEEIKNPMECYSKFEEVEETYFADALFIGDSRVVGLSKYVNLEGATYMSEVGLSVYTLMDKKFLLDADGKKTTIRQELEKQSFKKIYLMVGINELGTGDEERFQIKYKEVLAEIVELQPDAVIFIQSVLHVSEKKSKSEEFITNENITLRNEGLRKLADNKRIFFLDINSVYDDEEGNLNVEWTGDGVHVKAAHYDLWKQYLLQHGIKKE